MKFSLVGSYPNSVVSFRGELIRLLIANGFDVSVLTGFANPEVCREIESTGASFRQYSIQRNGLNPLRDFQTFRELRRAFGEIRPAIALAYTIKPVVWGGMAARKYENIRFFAMITGLGYAFQRETLKRKILSSIVMTLYRQSLRKAEGVIFQNADNLSSFVDSKIVPASKCHIVNGSGVDMDQYEFTNLPEGRFRFLLVGRLLGEKGIREYFHAAKIVKLTHPNVVFQLVGPVDPSPDGIPLDEVEGWHKSGVVDYIGSTRDVRPYLRDCHVYVLPSYHEGMPRTVLEAMAIGRPILTTDVSGCRHTVTPGVNGWLIPHANVTDLAARMIWFLEHKEKLSQMGAESRRIADLNYNVRDVNAEMLRILMGATNSNI